MPKLGSKKSRGGCTNCKRRRVKCDELKPCCSNCTKYKMSCVYQGSNISSRHEDDHIVRTARAHVRQPSDTVQQDGSESQTSTVSSHHNSNSLSVLADAVSSVEASSVLPPPLPPPPQVPYIDGFQTPSIPQQAHFTLLDLELLHHFLVYTYNSLARNNTAEIWRVNIPELAYTRDWLMRGLLSISAMHMVAEKEPDPQKTSDLISTAATSLNAGLAVVNHLVATADLSDKPTCSALASYTALVAVYALAMPTVQHHASIRLGMRGVSEPLDDAIGQLYTSFELVRGTAEVYRKVWHAISTGPMAPLTQVSIFSDSYDFITEYEGLLSKLKSHQNSEPMAKELSPRRQVLERIKNIKEWIDERIVNRARIKAACYLAQDRLSQIVLRVLVPEPSLSRGLIFAWPATFESLFMELLQEQYPPALALLAVFALILRGSSWLTRGWKWWILDALMEIRHAHGVHGDDVDDVWWCTISWAAQLAKNHPDFLESSLEDEGFA